jgi:pseudaminic acid synthase
MNEKELKKNKNQVRLAEKAMGKVSYKLTEKQVKGKFFSRSLFAVNDIIKGEQLSSQNVQSIRPGFCLHPKYYNELIGVTALQDIERGTAFSLELIGK